MRAAFSNARRASLARQGVVTLERVRENQKTMQNLLPSRDPARLNKIYDLLVSIGGAGDYAPNREAFVRLHETGRCLGWRFQADFGMLEEYDFEKNAVSLLSDNGNPEFERIISELNTALAGI